MTLRTAGFVAHVFVAAAGERAGRDRDRLMLLWDRLVADESLETVRDPRRPDSAAGGPLGFAEHLTDGGVRQAMLRIAHDVLVLSVVLEPPDGDTSSWRQLDRRWDDMSTGAGPLLGSDGFAFGAVRIYQGLLDVDDQDPIRVADAVQAAVPDGRIEPPWRDQALRSADGVMVWETGPVDDERPERRILALTGPEREAELSAWVWSGRGTALTPFTRYLLHAAKLRYQMRIWSRYSSKVEKARTQVDRITDDVLASLSTADALSQDDVAALLDRCVTLEKKITVLTRVGSVLRTIRRTAEIAAANRSAATPQGAPPSSALFLDDGSLGTWFLALLADEIHYLDTVREGAREVVTAVRAASERRSADLEKARDDRRESFALLQAALLGTLVVLLAAVQSLQYQVPLDKRVHPALIALISAVALTLGLALARKHELDHSDTRRVRSWASTPVLCGSVGLAAGAAGWLGETVVRVEVLGIGPNAAVSWTAAVLAGVVGAGSTAAVLRSRSRS